MTTGKSAITDLINQVREANYCMYSSMFSTSEWCEAGGEKLHSLKCFVPLCRCTQGVTGTIYNYLDLFSNRDVRRDS